MSLVLSNMVLVGSVFVLGYFVGAYRQMRSVVRVAHWYFRAQGLNEAAVQHELTEMFGERLGRAIYDGGAE